MNEFPPDRVRFNALLEATAMRVGAELRQDPNVALDVNRDELTVRGLIDIVDGESTWMPWPIDWRRMYQDAPEAVAYDFVEALTSRRRERALVRAALSSPKYEWRTIEGIAKEAGLSPDDVLRTISGLANEVIQSTVPDAKGRVLYATRKHYRATHSASIRLGNIFRAG